MKKAAPSSGTKSGLPTGLTHWRRKAPALAPTFERELAQELAVRALVYLAADSNRARRFAEVSGLSPDNLREAAETPDFLIGVLDYYAADESLLLAFAGNCGIDPGDLQKARAVLSAVAEE